MTTSLLPPQRVINYWRSQGIPQEEIAARCARLGEAVKKREAQKPWWSKKPGPKGLKNKLKKEKLERLLKKHTATQISKIYGVHPDAIRYWRRKWELGVSND